jgi:hypothetical protein
MWEQAFVKELDRLAQGVQDIRGADIIQFIHATEVPCDIQVTYDRLVFYIRPHKADKYRVRLTVADTISTTPGPRGNQQSWWHLEKVVVRRRARLTINQKNETNASILNSRYRLTYSKPSISNSRHRLTKTIKKRNIFEL